MEMEANAKINDRTATTDRKSGKVTKRKSRKPTQRLTSTEVDSDPQNDDEVTDATFHQRLLDKLQSLDSNGAKKKKPIVRSEAIQDISEYNLASSGKVQLRDLLKDLKHTEHLGVLKKQLNVAVKRNKTLEVPLHRSAGEKAQRIVAYKQAKSKLKKWDPVVKQNRLAEQVIFPLNQLPFRIRTADEVHDERFKPRTPLEIEMDQVLQSSKNNLTNKEELTEAEKEMLKSLSLEEVKARRAKLQKIRALISYQEAKMKRQKRIKSKKFHRILKRDKRRKIIKEFQDLQSKDPAAAKEKLAILEKDRIMERITLKHRNTGKWAKQLKQHAKHDPKMREALQEQLRYSKELSEKQKESSSESENEPVDEDPESLLASAANTAENMVDEMHNMENPWMQSTLKRLRKSQGESGGVTESEFVAMSEPQPAIQSNSNKETVAAASNQIMTRSKKKLQENVEQKRAERQLRSDKSAKISATDIDEIFAKVDNPKNSRGKAKIIQPEIEEIVVELPKKVAKTLPKRVQEDTSKVRSEPMLDPEKYLRASAKPLFSASSEIIEVMDETVEKDTDSQANLIAEAFADDDVIATFSAEKSAIAERDRPKPVDLTLPGWGAWTGPGVPEMKRKKKHLAIPAKSTKPRKDRLLPGVIISEAENSAIRKFQVKEVPFPFKSVEEFEASMRHPIGREWNPPSAHAAFCQPAIVTKMGSIIKPMNKKLVFRKGKTKGSGDETDSD